jgi:hypothetical protein
MWVIERFAGRIPKEQKRYDQLIEDATRYGIPILNQNRTEKLINQFRTVKVIAY